MTPKLWVQADLKRVGEELKDWEATMRHEALLLRDQVTSQGSGEGILAAHGVGTVHWQDWRLPAAGPCKARAICKALRLWSLCTGLFGDCLLRAHVWWREGRGLGAVQVWPLPDGVLLMHQGVRVRLGV